MKAITYTAAREGLAATMDEVCRDRAPVIITRNRDQAVVMLSLEDFNSMEETISSKGSVGMVIKNSTKRISKASMTPP